MLQVTRKKKRKVCVDMREPKVSVIVPVYNVERFLPECLDSILSQSLTELEIICVNDGSTDNSLQILEKYAKRDKRIVVISQKNGGISNARNNGMKLAHGKYIGFVDSDDFIERDMFLTLYERAEQANADISVCNLSLYNQNSGEFSEYRNMQLYLFLKNKKGFNIEEQPEFIQNIAAWDRIYKRSFIEQNHFSFPEGLIYEDQLFTIQTLLYAKCIVVTPEKLYNYRKNAGGSITDREAKDEKYKQDFLKINFEVKKLFSVRNISDEVRVNYLNFLIFNAVLHQKNAVIYTYAREFFDGMREILDDKDYKLIKEIDYKPARIYGMFLKDNSYICMYMYFWMRSRFYKENGWIWFRFNKKGKPIKIMKRG